ncbi:hypothetical protein ciss_01900 [Carboxydothermus islandicus]|uniref:Uncharacterized protein n=1 Tax=Carboxydothermus islandicus TaxID=661089 RepID=A0A1L8CZE0_9THEO|nr:hypothetical protein [Carboxydothermus islandicus]GAV24257.1 hypothetical protein ciss_01900 [Carboxydothermus islandicus]
MGKYVYCEDDTVWKYVAGLQDPELYRVPKKLGIGEYESKGGYEILRLKVEDVPLIRQYLEQKEFAKLKDEFNRLYLENTEVDEKGERWPVEGYHEIVEKFTRLYNYYFLSMLEEIANYIENKALSGKKVFEFRGEF